MGGTAQDASHTRIRTSWRVSIGTEGRERWMEPKENKGLHRRITSGEEEEEEDIDPLVNQQGCGRVYAQLETCLGEHDRDWRACQAQVEALKDCYRNAKENDRGRRIDKKHHEKTEREHES